jgi:hypothetical protein
MRRGGLPLRDKVAVGTTVWRSLVRVAILLRREPLPAVVGHLRTVPVEDRQRIDPIRLGRIVHRTLRLGGWRPRCLLQSLVLFDLLARQGNDAELVIGLPLTPVDKDAHAWIEIDGLVVGPPPGRAGHRELARYS